MSAKPIVVLRPGSEGSQVTKAIRRAASDGIQLSGAVRTLAGGALHIALEGAPDGVDWSEIKVWQTPTVGYFVVGDIFTRFPWLRARVWIAPEKNPGGGCVAVLDLALYEMLEPDSGEPSREIAS